MDPESACETIDPAGSPGDPERSRLCGAARGVGAPTFGDD
jgi:hypothetical protein